MSANTFGTLLRLTSFGESHGTAIGGVLDGCPPGMPLGEADLQAELDRRRPGTSRYASQRQEKDRAQLLSGVFEGNTTGTPIAFLIPNVDARSKDYGDIKDKFRPNHADYAYQQKYGVRDYRGGGRASARETAVRVAGGAIARKYLAEHGIGIRGRLAALGDIMVDAVDWSATATNPFFCAEPDKLPELESFMQRLIKEGDSIGAELLVEASGVPPGLGAPVYGRLDAELASAMMGINAVKAVGVGDGTSAARQRGTEHRDEITPQGYLSNHAGGVVGGISTGQTVVVRASFKPTSSIRLPARTIDTKGAATEIATHGRHDPCVALRAVPVMEAMMALVLMDHWLMHRAQNSEVRSTTPQVPPMAEPS